jgi:hypothetical protein
MVSFGYSFFRLFEIALAAAELSTDLRQRLPCFQR